MAEIDERGRFYLGRTHALAAAGDVAAGFTPEPVLYDSADLTTHAVCVGMTGSGKTGLCLALLEEAALDGIPAIAIDPKGDLGNLLLTFPELRASDFQPWIDPSAAARDGVAPEELAERTATQWKEGLAQWGEDGERIRRFKEAVDCAIYTPGSSAGLPLTVLKSFNAPSAAGLDDADAFSDRVQAAASGVLALLGVGADPVNSREHILLSKVLETAWRVGRDLDLPAMIHDVQKPPFAMVGAVPIDSFLSTKDRDALAMRLNNLLASPSFASWLTGEPLDVQRLLYTPEGKPRLSILSIAHLGDEERMFFVTLLLNEVISWMRSQSGTSSLRAILYMDEVFGYFPPTANPPAKKPMLTLLKQARAYGVGCVLATQNPVDLDYKGLSNAGTWLLGRLQTERDKARVLDGLEGASAEAGAKFDRAMMERTLSALGKRVFLMNNVHDSQPTVFQSRWALSYLAGPLTRTQISTLMADRKAATAATAPPVPSLSRGWNQPSTVAGGDRAQGGSLREATGRGDEAGTSVGTSSVTSAAASRPLLAGDITQRFVPFEAASPAEAQPTYRPALLGHGRIHYVQAASKLDVWHFVAALKPVDGELAPSPWTGAQMLGELPKLEAEPTAGAAFAPLPGTLGQRRTYITLMRELEDWLYQTRRFTQFKCEELNLASEGNETEAAFRKRAAPLLQAHRKRQAIEKRAAEIARLEKAIADAEADRSEHRWWFLSLLGNAAARFAEIFVTGLLGRRSRKQLVTSTLWNQAMKSRRLAAQAKKTMQESATALEKLKADEEAELSRLDVPMPPAVVPLTKIDVAPRKADVDVDEVLLVWIPQGVAP
jgi:hypothetical protein